MTDASPNATPEPDPASLSYEQAIEMVEAIADQIESGEVGLEASIVAYERGMRLIKRCRDVLDQAEQRITELTEGSGEASDRGEGR